MTFRNGRNLEIADSLVIFNLIRVLHGYPFENVDILGMWGEKLETQTEGCLSCFLPRI